MWKIGAAFAAVVVALIGCASQPGALPSDQAGLAPQAQSFVGELHIEPVGIIFKNGKSRGVSVRVWQHGFAGHFRVRDGCWGVTVYLRRYLSRHSAMFTVQPDAPGKEKCSILFTGSSGPRGTQPLEIRVLHR